MGKIFLEKPLCINFEQLKLIERKYEEFISKNSNYPVIMIDLIEDSLL